MLSHRQINGDPSGLCVGQAEDRNPSPPHKAQVFIITFFPVASPPEITSPAEPPVKTARSEVYEYILVVLFRN
ncbi:hypothetical protein E2C01_044276 [Portunus trituberculatus]|uniref:Uncharacterized protein n=1 Tax=Portunus trituberculatus TaxID=210409 RepID=A0A5B7G000_PORTR|nr:hypothetical protein [Portunus trituberculatus]